MQIQSLTESLFENPESESWVKRDFIKIYMGVCGELKDSEDVKVCAKAPINGISALLHSLINGDVSFYTIHLM